VTGQSPITGNTDTVQDINALFLWNDSPGQINFVNDNSVVGEQRIPTEVKEPPSEEQGIEEEGQVIARDEDGDDGDDDGPVPPECPLTGPIPPDCTMKPFPPKKALE
jgi:hypothetical protein